MGCSYTMKTEGFKVWEHECMESESIRYGSMKTEGFKVWEHESMECGSIRYGNMGYMKTGGSRCYLGEAGERGKTLQ